MGWVFHLATCHPWHSFNTMSRGSTLFNKHFLQQKFKSSAIGEWPWHNGWQTFNEVVHGWWKDIIYKSRQTSPLSNIYYSSIILNFWPELNHHLCFYLPIEAIQNYYPINCTGCTYTAGSTFSCQDDLSSIFCTRKCDISSCARYLLLLVQYSNSNRSATTILYFNYIKSLRKTMKR